MRSKTTAAIALAAALGLTPTATAETIGLTTNASTTVTLPATTVTAGPFPFAALGVKATATFSPGPIDISVGGGTSFTFPTISQGTVFTSADTLTIGYDPFWVGTVRATSGLEASADLQWKVGPFGGTHNILQDQVDPVATGSVALGGALQAGTASDTDSTGKYGAVLSVVNPFPVFIEGSLSAAVQGHLTQDLTWAPTAHYGFWTWADTDGSYDAGDSLMWHAVTGGALEYSFANLVAPNASTYFLNFIPGVMLDMPVGFDAHFGLDVAGTAIAKVFGVTVAQASFPLGSASWQLAGANVQFDPWWYASEAFSIPLTGNCAIDPATGQQTCTGYRVPAQTSTFTHLGPQSGGPNGTFSLPAPSFLPSNGFTDVTTGGFCVNGTCYSGIDDDGLGDPGNPPTVEISVTAVPEGGSLLPLASGLLLVAGYVRRRIPRG